MITNLMATLCWEYSSAAQRRNSKRQDDCLTERKEKILAMTNRARLHLKLEQALE